MKQKATHHEPKKRTARIPHWLKAVLVYAVSIVAIILIIFGIYSVASAGQIYPRVSVAGIAVGGLKPEQAKSKLEAVLKDKKMSPVILLADQNQSFTVKPDEIGANFDIEKSAQAAYAVGRSNQFFNDLIAKITTPLFGADIPAAVQLDQAKFDQAIQKITEAVNISEKDAQLVVKDGNASIAAATVGKTVKTEKIKEQILDSLGLTATEPIQLVIVEKEPALKEKDLENAEKQARAVLAQPILLTHTDKTYTATAAILGGWLSTQPVKGLLGTKAELQFGEPKIDSYIEEIASKIDVEPMNARLSVVGGQVVVIENSKDGSKLNRENLKKDLLRILTIRKELPIDALQTVTPSPEATVPASPSAESPAATASPTPELALNQISLEVEIKKPDVTNDNIAQVGIKERIAISVTDFKGSPANRSENIKLGTKLFNGVILKPGEVFSSVKSLGRIDESAGFKPELVIKQDQLTPEVGGGLCQVTTTLFRAAMNAGLKIEERRNHRFRVSYYEARPSNPDPEDYVTNTAKTLVGMDATIYDPSPDFKFRNDTDNYMLIQGRVEDTRLTFELFGTKDGRKTTIEGPFITSTTPAPSEIQYIDEPNLPTGVTKLKEKPVAGTKVNFKYKVEKDGKVINENTFGSTYVPWQAKYYRGTGPAASPSPSPTAAPEASPAAPAEAAPTATPAP